MKIYLITLGIYTKNGSICGTEEAEVTAENLEEAREEAQAIANDMENYYACVMVDEIQEIGEIEEEVKSELPF